MHDAAEAAGTKPPNIKQLPAEVLPVLEQQGATTSKRRGVMSSASSRDSDEGSEDGCKTSKRCLPQLYSKTQAKPGNRPAFPRPAVLMCRADGSSGPGGRGVRAARSVEVL